MSPEISIIVPVYRVEHSLRRCTDSILNQTFTDFELILVDDGSPDACPALCDAIAGEDRRVRVLHQKNRGLSAARNAGISAARGAYIGFVDSDDYVDKRMYELLLTAVRREEASVSLCSYLAVDEDGRELEEKSGPVDDGVMSGTEVIRKIGDMDVTPYLVSWNKLYSRSIFETLRFEEGKLHEDTRIFNHVFYGVKRVACVKEPLYFYVSSRNSIMRKKMSLEALERAEAFDDCFRFYEEQGLTELLAPVEKKIFGNLTDVYYRVPGQDRKKPEMRRMLVRHLEIIRILRSRRRLTWRTGLRTILFHFTPGIYGLRVKLAEYFKAVKNGV